MRDSEPPTIIGSILTPDDGADEPGPMTTKSQDVDHDAQPAFQNASIASVVPEVASVLGGTTHAVHGAGFDVSCDIVVSGISVETTFVDGYSLRFVAPPLPVGRAEVTVLRGDDATTPYPIAYRDPPVLTAAEPEDCAPDGGATVVIRGTGFEDGSTLAFNGERAVAVTFVDTETLTFVAPPMVGLETEVILSVTTPSGLVGREEGLFRYRAWKPRPEDVDPKTAWINGGKRVRVTGEAFHPRARVHFGDTLGEAHFVGPTLLEVIVPPRETHGPVTLSVENPGEEPVPITTPFVYEPIPTAPKLISVKPATGPCKGGVVLRLFGESFSSATRVRIGDVSAVVKSAQSAILDVELPPRAQPGSVAIELQDGDVRVRVEDVFLYTAATAMVVTSVEPASGPATGGSRVTIEGQHFPKSVSVRFGGEACRTVIVKSPTEIECVAPPRKSPGLVDLTLESSDALPVQRKAAFKYEPVPAPVITGIDPKRCGTEGGTVLEIEGKNFVDGVAVLFGRTPAASLKRKSPLLIEAKSPPGKHGEFADITVKNPDGQEATERRAIQFDERYD